MEQGKLVERFNPSIESGLSNEQVALRTASNLINKTKRKTNQTTLSLILRNVFSLLNIVLFIIAIFLIIFNRLSDCVFLVILCLNTTMGLYQDLSAKRAVDKLSLITKTKVKVVRNGIEQDIDSEELVLDDIVKLKINDLVPCDLVVISGKANVNESFLTGESDAVKKTNNDILLSGSYLTSGEVICRVERVGNDCYIANIENKTKEFKHPKTKLKTEMNLILEVLCIVAGITGGLQTIILLVKNASNLNDFQFVSDVIIGPIGGSLISLIPSGMYLLFSTTLLAGVGVLAKKRVLVHDMYSLDTLARVDTLCIDKTGTITDGTMLIDKIELFDEKIDKNSIFEMLKTMVHNIGDDNFTINAFKKYFENNGNLEIEEVVHFDSAKKYSAMKFKNDKTIAFGAYGFIKIDNDSDKIREIIDDYSKEGKRVLLLSINENGIENDELVGNSHAIGLVILKDAVKEDAKEIIKWFNDNEVNIKVISGDNDLTVQSIAKEVDIRGAENSVNLSTKDDNFIIENAEKYNVYGRTSPEQKKLIVESLIKKGHTVAMFGDGVNDILAFKAANVSISVANGANAAKDLASLIMVDNNFSGLPEVVFQGRRVINNLQRTCSLFLIKTSFSAILNVFFLFFGLFTRVGWPFTPGCFYAWEIASIGMSAFLLALEPNKERIKGGFIHNIILKAVPSGISLAFIVIVFYAIIFGTNYNGIRDLNSDAIEIARTNATWFISISSVFVLLITILPLNKFRIFVMGIDLILFFIISIWSIYSTNWLNLYPNNAPRIPATTDILTILVMVLTEILVLIGIYFVNFVRKRLKNNERY